MASTYLSLHYHLVFGTKDRLPLIDSAWRLRLHEYLGGIITPGINISMAALESQTARLPIVEIIRPAEVLGRSTVESIQSGLYYGTLATMRSLTAAVTKEHFAQDPPVIVGTGGFGRLFAEESLFDAFVPELPLLGLRRAGGYFPDVVQRRLQLREHGRRAEQQQDGAGGRRPAARRGLAHVG